MTSDQKLIEDLEKKIGHCREHPFGFCTLCRDFLLSVFSRIRAEAIEEERIKIREVILGQSAKIRKDALAVLLEALQVKKEK